MKDSHLGRIKVPLFGLHVLNESNIITLLCSGGKSAIMTGLVVALGGRAAQTSRGLSVKNFVKKGCR